MDSVVTAVRQLFVLVTGARPQFRQQGGSNAENLALQNIQVTCTLGKLMIYQFLIPLSITQSGKASHGAVVSICTASTMGTREKWWPACARKCQCRRKASATLSCLELKN